MKSSPNLVSELISKDRERKKGKLRMGYIALVVFILCVFLMISGKLSDEGYGGASAALLMCIWKLYYFKYDWSAVYKQEDLHLKEEKYAYLFKSYKHLAVPPERCPNAITELIITCPDNRKGNWKVENDWEEDVEGDGQCGLEMLLTISDYELSEKINTEV